MPEYAAPVRQTCPQCRRDGRTLIDYQCTGCGAYLPPGGPAKVPHVAMQDLVILGKSLGMFGRPWDTCGPLPPPEDGPGPGRGGARPGSGRKRIRDGGSERYRKQQEKNRARERRAAERREQRLAAAAEAAAEREPSMAELAALVAPPSPARSPRCEAEDRAEAIIRGNDW